MSYTPTTWVAGTTQHGPTNLNKLELGVQAAATQADSATAAAAVAQATASAALPTPAGSNGQFLKRVGGVWVPTTFLASDIPDPTAGKVLGSSGGACAAVFPPGYTINYTTITSTVNVASTTESSGTTIISPGAITFDGTPVLVKFFAPSVALPAAAGGFLVVSLFEGVTEIGQLCAFESGVASANHAPAYGEFQFTPTAAAHTYTVTAFASSLTGTPQIIAGSGGTSTAVPASVRFVKV